MSTRTRALGPTQRRLDAVGRGACCNERRWKVRPGKKKARRCHLSAGLLNSPVDTRFVRLPDPGGVRLTAAGFRVAYNSLAGKSSTKPASYANESQG
jgi:hypothetical protein